MVVALLAVSVAHAQPASPPPDETEEGPRAAGPVETEPMVSDGAIRERLTTVLGAVGGFEDLEVAVRGGVVVLTGEAESRQHQEVAAELAEQTVGVAAVVNQIELSPGSAYTLAPAREELRGVVRDVVRALPSTILALVIVGLGLLASRAAARGVRPLLARRVTTALLREVAVRAIGVFVALISIYLALRVVGLTRLAVTVIGGTGLIGLVVGIAFRGITENFLASLFLSVQQPFREGDLVSLEGVLGYVQRLTSRSTVLMTLDGTQVQIPNATVFASVISNFSSTPNRRESFVIGIGYDDSVPHAQQVALSVLRDHPAVLADPEPWVLLDTLGSATVNLKVYFWLDGRRHSWLKVRSSVMRLVKRAFQDAGISLPDEAREVVFPSVVPIRVELEPVPANPRVGNNSAEPEAAATEAEGRLDSEAADIGAQAERAWIPQGSENLLGAKPSEPR